MYIIYIPLGGGFSTLTSEGGRWVWLGNLRNFPSPPPSQSWKTAHTWYALYYCGEEGAGSYLPRRYGNMDRAPFQSTGSTLDVSLPFVKVTQILAVEDISLYSRKSIAVLLSL